MHYNQQLSTKSQTWIKIFEEVKLEMLISNLELELKLELHFLENSFEFNLVWHQQTRVRFTMLKLYQFFNCHFYILHPQTIN